jgi:hypothetical protein
MPRDGIVAVLVEAAILALLFGALTLRKRRRVRRNQHEREVSSPEPPTTRRTDADNGTQEPDPRRSWKESRSDPETERGHDDVDAEDRDT